jgi:hypothetical protein
MASKYPPGTDFSKIPAAAPPPGIQPNFVDSPSLFPAMVAIYIFMIL